MMTCVGLGWILNFFLESIANRINSLSFVSTEGEGNVSGLNVAFALFYKLISRFRVKSFFVLSCPLQNAPWKIPFLYFSFIGKMAQTVSAIYEFVYAFGYHP